MLKFDKKINFKSKQNDYQSHYHWKGVQHTHTNTPIDEGHTNDNGTILNDDWIDE